jgi:hypothetical protein
VKRSADKLLQILESDGRFEDHTGRKSHLIRSGFHFVGPLWHLDF